MSGETASCNVDQQSPETCCTGSNAQLCTPPSAQKLPMRSCQWFNQLAELRSKVFPSTSCHHLISLTSGILPALLCSAFLCFQTPWQAESIKILLELVVFKLGLQDVKMLCKLSQKMRPRVAALVVGSSGDMLLQHSKGWTSGDVRLMHDSCCLAVAEEFFNSCKFKRPSHSFVVNWSLSRAADSHAKALRVA